jgi:type I restriction enzyme S subunit
MNHTYLLYALPGYLDAVHAHTSSVTVKHLSSRTVQDLPLPLPPLNEQRRIVAAIEEQLSRLDAADESLAQARRKVKAFRRAALLNGFNGAWPRVPLSDVTDPARPICYGILKPKTVGDLQVQYVEVRSIKNGRVDVESLHRTTRALHDEFKRSELRAGDVVLAIRGSFDRAAVVPDQLEGANVSRDVARIAPLAVLDPRYLAHYLGGPAAYGYFAAVARGVAVRGVNIGDLRSMHIPLPPLEEQRRIVAEVEERLSVIDAMRASIERAERRSRALRRSILERAFRGELVPQDPSDEPASVLLERIRAERDAAPKRSKRTA